jgi:flagellar hook-associated protein 1 FlgK
MSAVNTAHATGFDLDGNAGVPFFVAGPSGIQVNPAIASDPRKVAASATAGTLDGSVASRIAEITGPDVSYRALVVGLGVESQTATRRVEIQTTITQQIDAARESEAGVSIDEEMTNLIAYQHAYDAAARFVNAVDETLRTLLSMAA